MMIDHQGIGYCKGMTNEKLTQLQSRQKQVKKSEGFLAPRIMAYSADIMQRKNMLQQAMTKDNFVKNLEKPMDKSNPNYGKPQEGTKTEARGKKAHSHVHKEILELCEIIYLNGMEQQDHTSVMLFGDLFKLYTRISDKVVGLLLRARKYGLVYFEPEMLFQGQNNDDPIFLTKPMQEIYYEFNTNKGFTMN